MWGAFYLNSVGFVLPWYLKEEQPTTSADQFLKKNKTIIKLHLKKDAERQACKVALGKNQ
jgi:hypothetical protein